MEYGVQIEHGGYTESVYVNKDRWVSYHHQTNLVNKYAKGGSVIEVGIGNGVVEQYLKKIAKVKTVDIDGSLNPDYVLSVDNLDGIDDKAFTVSLCAEVLEHIEYSSVPRALRELHRVSQKAVIISVPFWGYTFGISVRMPILGKRTIKFKISGIKKHVFNQQHYWELGKKGYTISRFKKMLKEANLDVVESFWDLQDPYHYYFVAECR